jgi:hypothetical protein
MVSTFSRTDKHKEKGEQETIIFGLCKTLIHLGFHSYMRVKEKQSGQNYHHYSSPAPLAESRAINEGINEARDSEA